MIPSEFADKLDPAAFAARKEQLVRRILFIALAGSQRNTPYRTGTLRRSETTRVEQGGSVGILGTNVVYAPFVHARVPFFQLGIDEGNAQIQNEIEQFGADTIASWS